MRILLTFLVCLVLSSCGSESTREGDRLFSSGEYEAAVEAYNDYLKNKPRHIKSLYNRGRAFEELGQYENALKDYEAVLNIDEMHVQTNLSVGINAFRNNDAQRALYHFGKAVEADPDNYKALVLHGRAFHKLGNFKSAMNDFDTAIKVNSEGGDAYFYRGIIFLDSNKKKACVDFQKASNLDVKDAKKALEKYCM